MVQCLCQKCESICECGEELCQEHLIEYCVETSESRFSENKTDL